jgi:putative hydrolase of the HAD superfamily
VRVEAVFVDAGGVLMVPDSERIASLLAPFGVAVDAGASARGHYAGVAALSRVAEGDREAFMPYHQAFAESCGVSEASLEAAVDALSDEFLQTPMFTSVLPGAVDALRALDALGVRIAIVTNSGGYAEDLLRELGICQVGLGPLPKVDAVFDSAIIGYEKPDPRIFEHALTHLAIEPDVAIHVGDTPAADVAGAVAAGIRPVLVDPLDAHSDMPHARVSSLAAVVPLVQDLNSPSK